jgi:hypothetical protein
MRLSTAALFAGIATPANASTKPSLDAGLIDLCDQFVANETERYLLMDHDEYAPDSGPNNARYEQLGNEQDRLIEMIGACQSSTIPAGHAAMARASLTCKWLRVFEGRRIGSKPPRSLDSGDRWKDAPRKIVRSAQTPITTNCITSADFWPF